MPEFSGDVVAIGTLRRSWQFKMSLSVFQNKTAMVVWADKLYFPDHDISIAQRLESVITCGPHPLSLPPRHKNALKNGEKHNDVAPAL